MVVEKRIESSKRCDSCNTVLIDRDAFLNDGSDYVELGDTHLCLHCAGKVFHKYILKFITEPRLKKYAKGVANPFKPTPLTMPEIPCDIPSSPPWNVGDTNGMFRVHDDGIRFGTTDYVEFDPIDFNKIPGFNHSVLNVPIIT